MAVFFLVLYFAAVILKLTSSIHQENFAQPDEYRYIVQFINVDTNLDVDFGTGTGTVINENTILTAAHCFDGVIINPNREQDPNFVHIVHGNPDQSLIMPIRLARKKCIRHGLHVDETTGRPKWFCFMTRFLTGVLIPEGYKKGSFKYDIALIKLANADKFKRGTFFPNLQAGLGPSENCKVVGFGATEGHEVFKENRMRYAVTPKKFEVCLNHEILVGTDTTETEYRLLCSKDRTPITEPGDSGGPLICNDRIYGVLSHGFRDAGKDWDEDYDDCYTPFLDDEIRTFLETQAGWQITLDEQYLETCKIDQLCD